MSSVHSLHTGESAPQELPGLGSKVKTPTPRASFPSLVNAWDTEGWRDAEKSVLCYSTLMFKVSQ